MPIGFDPHRICWASERTGGLDLIRAESNDLGMPHEPESSATRAKQCATYSDRVTGRTMGGVMVESLGTDQSMHLAGPLQNAIGDATKKKVRNRASTMGSKNDEIDPQTFCLGQDQIDRNSLEFYDR